MPRRPLVLVHGYSDKGESFGRWRQVLTDAGYDARTVHLGSYVSLSNEITIKDIAEGFDRALRHSATLRNDEPFDAIVHSTGMLVIREWLAGTVGTLQRPELAEQRQARLKHLIGLAPATFGSPIAHKGRSWLGAIFKGGKEPGPDFMEAGDQVLRGLELGSAYTWDLAHRDLLNDSPVYSRAATTPYPFVFVGLRDYGWLKRGVTEDGTDGTVRWSGVGFNSRKIRMNLMVEPTRQRRVTVEPWRNVHVPLVFLPDHNHSDIIREPSEQLVSMVMEALDVSSGTEYDEWSTRHAVYSRAALKARRSKRYQQFIVRAIDERGDGINDYFIEIGSVQGGRFKRVNAFDLDVHAYREDLSYRAFHVDLDKLDAEKLPSLALRIIASSGTELLAYHGYSSSNLTALEHEKDKWDAVIQFDASIGSKEVQFFFPYTTTLVEVTMNREPMPLEGANRIFWFLQERADGAAPDA